MRLLRLTLIASLVSASVVIFQNCSGGSLPQDASAASEGVDDVQYAPLDFDVINRMPQTRAVQTVTASGGKYDYVFSSLSGTCVVTNVQPQQAGGAVTATVTAAEVAGSICQIRVTDARGVFANATITVQEVPATTPVVRRGDATYSTAGTDSLVLPPYNQLTIEVWGAGGEGGGQGVNGGAGEASTVKGTRVNAMANGGFGGGYMFKVGSVFNGESTEDGIGGAGAGASGDNATQTVNGSNGTVGNGGQGASGGPGAPRAPSGTVPTAPGTAPGGGGAGYGYLNHWAGGGGGGGYVRVVLSAASGPAAQSTLTIKVGAGGKTTPQQYGNFYGSAGAPGRVKISWE